MLRVMNYSSRPLVPEDISDAQRRRSIVRAVAAMTVAAPQKADPAVVLRKMWQDDSSADHVLRAATNPTSTANVWAIQTNLVLPMLAPAAASTRLFALSMQLSLDGIATLRLPFIGGAGRPSAPVFIAEGAAAPVVDLATSAAILGPTCKLCILSAVSGELQEASADTAEDVVSAALAFSAEQSIDSALFSANAATPIAPAGIWHGIVPIASSGSKGQAGAADDLGALAGQIGSNGVNSDDMVVVTTPDLAARLRVLASPKFTNTVLSSAYIPSGTVIGVVPRGLAVGYAGNVEITSSIATAVHFEDTNPLPLGSGGTLAVPILSAWQQYLIILKIHARCAWCVQPQAVAVAAGANW
jgi:hypothetical protein